jgi:HD superfamily phosphohydrolase
LPPISIALHKSYTYKKKILNDPVYGFITIPEGIIFQLIEHPYLQRLKRITQLGLTYYVFPGALHNRFQHTLGALHLMGLAIASLRSKGIVITETEAEAVSIGILMHDIGHGPYSHTLETVLLNQVNHEFLSECFMQQLNTTLDGKLSLAIEIFQDRYHKKFLHQLISSQLDVDRLDYLKRDSFFTGVHEGTIPSDRLIHMMYVHNDALVIEEKGIYSVEKFLISRRLMYWQVYMHKTVLSAEYMLVNILKRAKELSGRGEVLPGTEPLQFFLKNDVHRHDFLDDDTALRQFALLDDFDIMSAVKMWTGHRDKVLSSLCNRLINRRLLKVEISKEPFSEAKITELKKAVAREYRISEADTDYFVFTGEAVNSAYNADNDNINIYYKDGSIQDIALASDQMNINVLSKPVVKYFLCYPKEMA